MGRTQPGCSKPLVLGSWLEGRGDQASFNTFLFLTPLNMSNFYFKVWVGLILILVNLIPTSSFKNFHFQDKLSWEAKTYRKLPGLILDKQSLIQNSF